MRFSTTVCMLVALASLARAAGFQYERLYAGGCTGTLVSTKFTPLPAVCTIGSSSSVAYVCDAATEVLVKTTYTNTACDPNDGFSVKTTWDGKTCRNGETVGGCVAALPDMAGRTDVGIITRHTAVGGCANATEYTVVVALDADTGCRAEPSHSGQSSIRFNCSTAEVFVYNQATPGCDTAPIQTIPMGCRSTSALDYSCPSVPTPAPSQSESLVSSSTTTKTVNLGLALCLGLVAGLILLQ
jgi:hypothetical protein